MSEEELSGARELNFQFSKAEHCARTAGSGKSLSNFSAFKRSF